MNEGAVPKPADDADHSGGPVVVSSNRQDRAIDEAALTELAERTLRGEGIGGQELSLSFVAIEEMADLHERYMNEPGATDVLSFPMGEEALLGDVVVCPEFASRNNPDLEAELRLLVVHGVLHLLGYDHDGDEERRVMWERQERYSGVRA